MSNALPVQIGREVISMLDDIFSDTLDQLNKLTIIRYDHLQENDAQRNEELRRSKYSNKRRKVSSFLQRVR